MSPSCASRDAYGLTLTTSSQDATAAYDRGVDAVCRFDRSAVEFFREAVLADPRLAVAHAGAAVSLFSEEHFEEARAAAITARSLVAGACDRERGHVEALALVVERRLGDAERIMRAHLLSYPEDFFVAHRLYFVLFIQGRFQEMADLTQSLLAQHPEWPFILGMHAFIIEELGHSAQGLTLAEKAVARDPKDAWAVHAIAHALYETGEFDEGLCRLPPAIHKCTQPGAQRHHLFWHMALLHLSKGNYARASALCRGALERSPSSMALDLRDSISFLWRLRLCGIDVSARWQPFVDIARRRAERPDELALQAHAHLAMAFAGGGDWSAAENHLATLRSRAAGDRKRLTGDVAVPLIEGLHASALGDWTRTIHKLEGVRARYAEIGGSRAQSDVFEDTLFDACFRAEQPERAEALLAQRLARRPDHFWVERSRTSANGRHAGTQ